MPRAIKDVVALVEAKEMTIKAWNSAQVSGTAGLSSYRKDKKTNDDGTEPLKAKLDMKGKCSECRITLYRKFPSDKINKKLGKKIKQHFEDIYNTGSLY